MGLPLAPRIPSDAVPMHVDGLHNVLVKARFWARSATIGAVIAAGAIVYGALTGRVPWLVAVALVALPYFPIAAATRIDEAIRIIEDQLRDRAAERLAA